MGTIFTVRLEQNDLGQLLDGLRCRRKSWDDTANYLETGAPPGEYAIVEECSDAAEARGIADHYSHILATIEAQVAGQRGSS